MQNNQQSNRRLLSTSEAAPEIGCASSTLKISRVTGKLLGRDAPEYIKFSKKVVYDRDVLRAWVDQVGTRKNTAS
jgi:hypothetical protein